jgi:LCP family protein required for cell wall assembly
VLLWSVSALALAVVVTGVLVAVKLRSNITVVDVNDALASEQRDASEPESGPDGATLPFDVEDEPSSSTEPVNILVMGSDTRVGQGDGFGSPSLIEGARSDTTLLVHLSADRQHVTAVSIPRDLIVTVPSCTMPDGTTTYPYDDRFNAAYFVGGPECTIRTVTALTGLPIHHFVVVDFTAFERTIDALGGVEVCLTSAVDDPKAGLTLPAGVTRVDGEQGLAFVRARETLGDGSDLARIERQQAFLGSLVREATSRDLLTDPLRLVRSLDAATQSLTTDARLASLTTSVPLARSLAGISPSQVSFVTLPNEYDAGFLTVSPDESEMALLVEVLAADVAWPFQPSDAAATVPPSQVSVTVANGTGLEDQGGLAGSALSLQGFDVVGLATADVAPQTQVFFPAGSREEALTVAATVHGAVVVADDSLDTIQLVLGTEWTVEQLRTVTVTTPAEDEAFSSTGTSPDDSPWIVPDEAVPQGETSTAQSATCSS